MGLDLKTVAFCARGASFGRLPTTGLISALRDMSADPRFPPGNGGMLVYSFACTHSRFKADLAAHARQKRLFADVGLINPSRRAIQVRCHFPSLC